MAIERRQLTVNRRQLTVNRQQLTPAQSAILTGRSFAKTNDGLIVKSTARGPWHSLWACGPAG